MAQKAQADLHSVSVGLHGEVNKKAIYTASILAEVFCTTRSARQHCIYPMVVRGGDNPTVNGL